MEVPLEGAGAQVGGEHQGPLSWYHVKDTELLGLVLSGALHSLHPFFDEGQAGWRQLPQLRGEQLPTAIAECLPCGAEAWSLSGPGQLVPSCHWVLFSGFKWAARGKAWERGSGCGRVQHSFLSPQTS